MARFKTVEQARHEGKIVYNEKIVDDIVIRSLGELNDVELCSGASKNGRKSNAVKVVFGKDGVRVEVSVKIRYNQRVSDMAFTIQETIRNKVESLTEFHIVGVNVFVKGVLFDEVKDPSAGQGVNSETSADASAANAEEDKRD